jgi:catechol 2,3-dioxygenase-like lactoylglutathione lyase family enzyme
VTAARSANAPSPSTATCCRPTAAPHRGHHRRLRGAGRRDERLLKRREIKRNPIVGAVAAISVGIYRGTPVLDLDYAEDSDCDTDMNVVMNDGGGFIELQGTAEGHAFRRDELDRCWHWPPRAPPSCSPRSARRWPVKRTLALVTYLVPDYDAAIDWFVRVLGFVLLEDTDRATASAGCAWPPPSMPAPPCCWPGRHARAAGAHRRPDRWPGRPFPAHRRLRPRPCGDACRGRALPRTAAPRGLRQRRRVRDPYGNRWDLLEPAR